MKTRLIALSLLSTLTLAGCGGGGGGAVSTNPGGGSNGGGQQPPPPPVDQNALQTSVAAATYAAGSSQLSAFTALNTARQAYGVGLLAQNAKIDVAASNHAQYVSQRWGAKDFANTGHTEDSTKPGYTGVGFTDRIAGAGYSASAVGEVLTTFISVDGVTSDAGSVAVNTLLSGPYHRMALLDSMRDVGIADANARFAGEGGLNHTFVIDMGTAQGAQPQLPASGWVGVWPMANATDVMYAFAGESPDPIPVNNGACAGYPVSLQVLPSLQLTTTAFTLVDGTGAAVAVQLSTSATDKNPGFARGNSAYIIPFKPLKLGTKYTAHFVGTAGTTAIDKTWSFTTTTQNTKMVYGCDPS